MADEKYQFCKIFLRTADTHAVMELLSAAFDARFERKSLDLVHAMAEVLKNPDAGGAEDFVGWPIFVEVEAEPDADDASVVEITSKIVRELWDADIPAVAACDYEEELPWGGGLHRLTEKDRTDDQ
jgi:hypothetical protein